MKKLLGFLLFIGFIAVLYFFMTGYFSIKKGNDGSYIFKVNNNSQKEEIQNIPDALEKNLNVSLPDSARDEIQNAVNELKSMGFSTDVIIEEASNLYNEYGQDAINHIGEAFENMAKDTVTDTAHNILDDIKNTILNTVDSFVN